MCPLRAAGVGLGLYVNKKYCHPNNVSIKSCGCRLGLYVNKKYCHPNNVSIKSCMCMPNSETLVVSIRPYYLPGEFSYVINITVYVPHTNNAKQAGTELYTTQTFLRNMISTIFGMWTLSGPAVRGHA